MINLNTNLGALIVQSNLKTSTNGLNQAIERLTTGFKINHAKDNAAGYSIAKLSSQLSSYDVALDNASMGLDMLTTAQDSLDLITSHYQRMRDLAEQAANGTYGADSLKAIQAEIDARSKEIGRIVNNTEYNGIKFFGHETEPEVTIDESKRVVNQTTFTKGETYFVTNSDDLVKLQDLVNSRVDTTDVTFELTSNIDMKGIDFRGIGTYADGHIDAAFQGTFNGNNHVISNLTINKNEKYVGLFGCISQGIIDSVVLENCSITGASYTGGLAGTVWNRASITNCYVTGEVRGLYHQTGGLIGSIDGSTITNSAAACSVIGSGDWVGGLVGYARFGVDIINCYATGNVRGSHYGVGGLIGKLTSSSNVTSSYALGSVSALSTDPLVVGGGLVGELADNSSINKCYATGSLMGWVLGGLVGSAHSSPTINGYYDTQKTGKTKGVGSGSYNGPVTGVTTAELEELIKNGTLPQYNYGGGTGGGTGGGVLAVHMK